MKDLAVSMLKDECGQGYAEYMILVGLIAIVGITAVRAFGVKVSSSFNSFTGQLP